MVLSGGQSKNRFAIGDCQDTHLRSLESFLDNHLRTRFTELIFSTYSIDRVECILSARANDDPFSTCQTVGFDDHRCLFVLIWIPGLDVPHGAVRISKHLVVRRGYVGLSEQ